MIHTMHWRCEYLVLHIHQLKLAFPGNKDIFIRISNWTMRCIIKWCFWCKNTVQFSTYRDKFLKWNLVFYEYWLHVCTPFTKKDRRTERADNPSLWIMRWGRVLSCYFTPPVNTSHTFSIWVSEMPEKPIYGMVHLPPLLCHIF